MSEITHEVIELDSEVQMRYSCLNCDCVYSPRHWHNSIEIIYVKSGQVGVHVAEVDVELKKDEFVIIDRKEIHATWVKEESDYLLIQIPYEFLKQFIRTIDLIRFPVISPVTVSKDEIYEQVKQVLLSLYELWHHKYADYAVEFYKDIFEILQILMKNYKIQVSAKEHEQTEKYIERLSMITDYVQEHFRKPISLTDAANLVSFNNEYFARFFKKYMGVTFLQYVNTIRLQHIQMDLEHTDLPIQEILEQNGFTNYKVFMRMFKTQNGCTPNEYRKKIQNRTNNT